MNRKVWKSSAQSKTCSRSAISMPYLFAEPTSQIITQRAKWVRIALKAPSKIIIKSHLKSCPNPSMLLDCTSTLLAKKRTSLEWSLWTSTKRRNLQLKVRIREILINLTKSKEFSKLEFIKMCRNIKNALRGRWREIFNAISTRKKPLNRIRRLCMTSFLKETFLTIKW